MPVCALARPPLPRRWRSAPKAIAPLPHGRPKAEILLGEAVSITTGLGLKPPMERVATRLPDLGTPPEIWVTYPSGLT